MAGKFWRGISLLALLLPGPALADEMQARVVPGGVWQGTLGRQRIMLCINPPPDYMHDYYEGNYYYLRHLRPIHLSHESNEKGWVEQDEKGRQYQLTLDMQDSNSLTGSWTHAAQKLTLPIRLQRVDMGDDDAAPCGSDAYNAPLEAHLKLSKGKVETFQGHHYRAQTLDADGSGQMSISVISLQGTGRIVSAINADLQTRMPKTELEIDDRLFYCRRNALSQFGEDGTLTQNMWPVFWGRRWLSLAEEHSFSCGGNHPGEETVYTTWNLRTGKAVNLWSWVSGANDQEIVLKPPEGLNQLVLSYAEGPRDKYGCAEGFDRGVRYFLHLGGNGLIFSAKFSYALHGCDEDIVVPYRELMPYLTAEAKSEVQSILRGE